MKKLVFIFLLFQVVSSFSQENHSTINFWFDKGFTKSAQFDLVINNRRITSCKTFEIVKYKIHSTGLINLEVFYRGAAKSKIQIDIEHGEQYFIRFFYKKGYNLVSLNSSEFKELVGKEDYFKQESNYEEDIKKPVGDLPSSLTESRPKQGSGFLINDQGYIITNFHVIEDASKINVKGIKGDFNTVFEATLISADRQNDLALLQVQSKLLTFNNPPFILSNSKTVGKAERVFALGYPFESAMGSEVKITDGIINSLTGFKGSISEFQFSAPIQGGNSGGPLFNSNGELIGIVSAKIRSDVADQVSYAIKSNYLEFFLEESGVTEFIKSVNILSNIELTEQIKLISDFVYIIETE